MFPVELHFCVKVNDDNALRVSTSKLIAAYRFV